MFHKSKNEKMKNKLLAVFSLLTVILLSSCETDFEVAADWKEITTIHALLNAADDAQYIRVNKAFLGEKIDALEVAQIADSLYHENEIQATMTALDESGNERGKYELEIVNATDDGLYKEEGIFATEPYLLYKLNTFLNQDHNYRINITTHRGNVLTAETPIVKDFTVRTPNPQREIDLSNLQDIYTLRWNTAENGFISELEMKFNYQENRIEGGEIVTQDKFIIWKIFSNKINVPTDGSTFVTHTINSADFFDFINRRLTADDLVKDREFVSMDFTFYIGSEEFKKFRDVTLAQSGITSGQAAPQYTNIEGQGLGIFTSRYRKEIKEVPLNSATIDELACGVLFGTSDLKFRPNKSNPSYPNCN